MTAPYTSLRRKQRTKQEPDKQYDKSDFDGSDKGEAVLVDQ